MLEILQAGALGAAVTARVSGDWTFARMQACAHELEAARASIAHHAPGGVQWDLAGLVDLDDAGAVWLARAMRGAAPDSAAERFRGHLELAATVLDLAAPEPRSFDPLAPVLALGRAVLRFAAHAKDAVALLGQLAIEAARYARRPRETPLFEISANVFRTGVAALPVTMLVGFLVGVVLTYLSALQLKKFGADLLVINIVGVGVVRELGPMLASIISAGRSGSTMTAQLGVMRVTEEIEALSVMGVAVTGRLVLPKVVGLAIALPLVTFATDLAALAGAMLVAQLTLGIEAAAFLSALPRVMDVENFWIGIGKAVAFGFAVAFVACHYGLRILPNTESLGEGVTRSVVAAITSVILLDAVFAIALRNVG